MEHIEAGRQSIHDIEEDVLAKTPLLFFTYAEAAELERETLLVRLAFFGGRSSSF
jgi:hypothetical protein